VTGVQTCALPISDATGQKHRNIFYIRLFLMI
jgi:hypothetical protein